MSSALLRQSNAFTREVEQSVYDLRKSHAAIVQRPATSQNALVKSRKSALQHAAQIQQQREMAFGGFMMRPSTVYNSSSTAQMELRGLQNESGFSHYEDNSPNKGAGSRKALNLNNITKPAQESIGTETDPQPLEVIADTLLIGQATEVTGVLRQNRVGIKSALVKRKPHRHTASLPDRRSRAANPNQHYEGLPADPLRGSSPGVYGATTTNYSE